MVVISQFPVITTPNSYSPKFSELTVLGILLKGNKDKRDTSGIPDFFTLFLVIFTFEAVKPEVDLVSNNIGYIKTAQSKKCPSTLILLSLSLQSFGVTESQECIDSLGKYSFNSMATNR